MIINMNGAKAPQTPSPVLQEKTVTPQTLPTVIGADEGYDGLSQVTVNPDTNLKAENIRSGKTIFGVDGTFVGEPYPVADEEAQFFYDVIRKAPSATPPTQPIRATALRGQQQFMGAVINSGILDLSNVTFGETSRLFGWSTLNCELILPSLTAGSSIFNSADLAWFPKGTPNYSNASDGFNGAKILNGDVTLTSDMFPTNRIPSSFLVNMGRPSGSPSHLNITIPENITNMSNANCVAFAIPLDYTINLIMKPLTPPTLAVNSFSTNTVGGFRGKVTITVPKGSLESYQTATNWSNYASVMVEANE